jgi:hypothetical protein
MAGKVVRPWCKNGLTVTLGSSAKINVVEVCEQKIANIYVHNYMIGKHANFILPFFM